MRVFLAKEGKNSMLESGPTPLYYQLKNVLKTKILSGEIKGHERFPTEAELCDRYNVSRITVRHALTELFRDGLIYRQRGKGTFVTEGAELKKPELKGSIENLITSAEGTKLKVLAFEEVQAPPSLVKSLHLKESAKLFRLTTVRYVSKGPLGYSLAYFPYNLGKEISVDEIKETTELITFVEAKLKTRAHRAKQSIDATVADGPIARHLAVKPGTPLLLIERIYYDNKGSVMFVAIAYFRSDLYKYEIELTRS